VRSSSRVAVALLLSLTCVLALGALSSPASATWADRVKAGHIRSHIHTLQVAIQSYAVDNRDLYPRFTSNRQFRALLSPYIDSGWPRNPYTHHSMRQKRSRGNFTYATYGNLTRFRLIGWGPDGRRIIVVP
jgi:hypothetical protein